MILLLREWYLSPMGQLPAYEWNFSDVNPPVHAWASLNIYRIEKSVHGRADIDFLKRIFQKLLINFTWWVNRKDMDGNNIFEGGFLELDNIGVINRNEIPEGYTLEQVEGTLDGHLWHKEDAFFYDVLIDPQGGLSPKQVRSVVGLSVLFGVSVISGQTMTVLKDFERRIEWFKDNRKVRGRYLPNEERKEDKAVLLTLINKGKLEQILRTLFDENEFLGPGGIRGLSKFHLEHQGQYTCGEKSFEIKYDPAESTTNMFGGNSNWRGLVWLPINYLIIKSLKKNHQFYGEQFKMEFPTGSGNWMTLGEISNELAKRIISTFTMNATDKRPVNKDHAEFYARPENKELVLFYEYFHGDTSRGVGASHQTGWTALVAELINDDACEWE